METILIRWINYHLKKAGQDLKISNLGKDLADSVALFHVLNRIDASKCPLDGVNEENLETRAEKMISNTLALGVPDIARPRDIVTGNVKVNTLFVANIFNTKHGLEDLTKEEYEAAAMLDDDIEGSREERVFRLWINSLGLEDVYINDLFDDAKSGVLLNKVIEKIQPGVVEWKKIDLAPNNDFKKNINNNTCLDAAKKINVKLIGVGGVDITKGDKKSILALVWQLCRLNYLKVIGNKTEDDLLKWANDLVGGKHPSIQSFKDKSMSDSKFLIHLLSAIEPRAVNWDLVQAGETDEEKQNNAKYAISIARKLGAVIYCIWEDLVNVNPKQMLIFIATMFEIQQELANSK